MIDIVFIDYDQVTDTVSVMVNDPTKEQPNKKEEFTLDALKELLSNINDNDYSPRAKSIAKVILNKGGMNWLMSEIKRFRLNQLAHYRDLDEK